MIYAQKGSNSCTLYAIPTPPTSRLVAEMLSHVSGMDWFVIDMEHSPNELNDVLLQLQASQHGSAEPVVRVPWAEPVVVKRVLDLGAQTLIFPWINTPQQATEAVQSTRYPGLGGIRGVMSLARMNNYGAQNPHYYKAQRLFSEFGITCFASLRGINSSATKASVS